MCLCRGEPEGWKGGREHAGSSLGSCPLSEEGTGGEGARGSPGGTDR